MSSGMGRVRSFFSSLFKSKAAKIGGIILGAIILVMLIGPIIDPNSPYATGPNNLPPSLSYPFGTDYLGHDIFSEIAWGAYSSLSLSLYSALGATVLGFVAGLLSGYYGKLEGLLSGATDVVLCFPNIPLLIIVGLIFPANYNVIVFVIAFVLWAPVSRAIRAQTLAVKKLSYIESIKMAGMKDFKIIWRVISFEVASIGVAYFIINLSVALVLVTALEFIGMGDPLSVNWGSILYWAQQYAFGYGDWWWVLAPGAIITLVATSFALIGMSFEEMMNPRLRV